MSCSKSNSCDHVSFVRKLLAVVAVLVLIVTQSFMIEHLKTKALKIAVEYRSIHLSRILPGANLAWLS